MTVEQWIQEEAEIAAEAAEKKGREEDREEGLEEGRNKRDQEMIEEMLRRGKKPEEIADFCGYPIELIKDVEEKLFKIQ